MSTKAKSARKNPESLEGTSGTEIALGLGLLAGLGVIVYSLYRANQPAATTATTTTT